MQLVQIGCGEMLKFCAKGTKDSFGVTLWEKPFEKIQSKRFKIL